MIDVEGFEGEDIKTSAISLLRKTGVIGPNTTINDDKSIDDLYINVLPATTALRNTKFQITLGVATDIYEAEGGLGDKLADTDMLKQLHDGPIQPGFGGRG